MDNLENTLVNTPNMFVPTAFRQVAQLTDDTQRNTYNESTVKQGLNLITNKLPGLSKTLEPKIDTFGNEVKTYQGKNNLFNVMLNPGTSTTYKPNDVQQEILRLYNGTGEKSIFPSLAPKSLTYNKKSVKLSPSDITKFQQTMGKLTESKMRNTINDSKYKDSNEDWKVKQLKNAVDEAYDFAKYKLLRNKGLLK
jgi:hypothetical protein